jgi:hypothetical protein
MWTMFIFFAWVIWIWLLIMVLADNFARATSPAGRRQVDAVRHLPAADRRARLHDRAAARRQTVMTAAVS